MARHHPGAEDPLCCCEYFDTDGQRNHIVMCCCNCDALDTVCDRWLTCKDVSPESSQKLIATIEDRCRLPWLYGAIQIKLDVVLPMLAVPSGLLLASVSLFWTVVAAVIFPTLLLLFYRVWTRQLRHRRSQLFYIWGVTSLVITYYIFLLVVSYREILAWEMLLESSLFMLTLCALYHARKSPGVMTQSLVKKQQRQPWKNQWHFQPLDGNISRLIGEEEERDGETAQELGDNSHKLRLQTLPDPDRDWRESAWCKECRLQKLPRSGHCPVCNVCVMGRDHHCLWIDNCIGASNHRSFFLCLLLVIVTGCYGSHLTLTTICTPEIYLDWFLWPSDCRFMYDDSVTAICFVGACYTIVCTTAMTFLLVQQILLISQNVTSYELHLARQRSQTTYLFFVLGHERNRGFCQNWFDFVSGRRKRRTFSVVHGMTV
ncbi:hypothetical protein NP493_75g09010 [Ridgeia piscesae]|uniref:Palmitoyltransferase n=1 Tax=Ridgeia piscesae TaxID=27915 RepID=A0AAD9P9I3_RIDPI|nr:hypothetical protein NP493_75g09010 [Ridgeia piscesae]